MATQFVQRSNGLNYFLEITYRTVTQNKTNRPTLPITIQYMTVDHETPQTQKISCGFP